MVTSSKNDSKLFFYQMPGMPDVSDMRRRYLDLCTWVVTDNPRPQAPPTALGKTLGTRMTSEEVASEVWRNYSHQCGDKSRNNGQEFLCCVVSDARKIPPSPSPPKEKKRKAQLPAIFKQTIFLSKGNIHTVSNLK